MRGLASRLILQAPYTSIPAVAQSFAPVFPMSWLMDDHYDNLGKATAVRLPTLIMHGDAIPWCRWSRLTAWRQRWPGQCAK